jgi:uncharacterized Tic20 family protein
VSDTLHTNELPSQDDRIMAALAHVSVLLPFTGLLAPIIIWATQKNKSPYVRFQALQAVAFQITLIVAWFAGGACYMCSAFGTFPLMVLAAPSSSTPPQATVPLVGFSLLAIFLPFVVFGLAALVGIAFLVYGLIAAVLTLQGKPFKYVILGRRIERYLESTPPAAP